MFGIDAYGLPKLQLNTVLGSVCSILSLIIVLAYTAVEI